jgi:hypothetical protein
MWLTAWALVDRYERAMHDMPVKMIKGQVSSAFLLPLTEKQGVV